MITINYNKDLFLLILLLLMVLNGVIKTIAGIILYGREKDHCWGLADTLDGLVGIAIVACVILM